ncbi:glycosyltransferase family 2 protein [Tunicatimonas pelagia]|uniref:glycosyltransferase family 2 protein n=1 Tax=Tunicatimonas pelagia TaxID=931531 RepID=UPI0026651453|nr:glycosyltransferase family 2 protein [Tunicatimonas pelagia]WKN41400.1 glycosyltransferase family 2 protein [Tunicatimonas pelagia]
MNTRISILMSVRDTEQYLPACLDSIVVQTYANWELVAVNNDSSDRSKEILMEYSQKDSRIRVYDTDRIGLIPALQTSYRHAQGTLVTRMDSDDIMPPDKLEVMHCTWQQYGKGTVVAGGTKYFMDGGEVGGGFRRYERWLNQIAKDQTYYEEIYRECVIPSQCWLVHRDDFNAAKGFAPEVYPEDYDLCFRFYQQKLRVVGIDKILNYCRDRPDRTSRNDDNYQDNRFFDLKIRYFYELDRDFSRPLVLWGAGRKGKDLAKLLLKYENHFHWVCNNSRKIGKEVYGVNLEPTEVVAKLDRPQILVAVTSPPMLPEIQKQLTSWGKQPMRDFWFFA